MTTDAAEREAMRQQLLLRVLWRDAQPALLHDWLRDAPARAGRGLAAYRANAGASAERALAAAFPTVASLVGDESFAGLARAFWHHTAPECGDLGEFGAGLPDFIAASEQLASEAYLSDSARLDWAVHRALRAADAPAAAAHLQRLAEGDPAQLILRLRPGCALLRSLWPVVAIRAAHESAAADRFDAVRNAFAAGQAQTAFVRRDGLAVRVDTLATADDAVFTEQVLAGSSLAAALDAAGTDFAFDRWLQRALRERTLTSVDTLETSSETPSP